MCQLSCVMTPLCSTHSTFHRTWLYSAILHRSRVQWSPHGGYGVQLTGVQAWAHLSKWKPFHRQPPVFFTGSPEYFVNCHQKYFVKCSPPLRIVTTWGPRRTLLQLWKCQRGHLRNLLYNEIVVVERPLTVKWLFIDYCLFLEWEIIFSKSHFSTFF